MVLIRFFAAAVLLALTALSDRSAAQEKAGRCLDVAAYLDLVDQAKARSTAKQWVQAAELLTTSVAINHLDVNHWTQLATARYNARDFAGAITACEKVLQMGGELPSIPAYSIVCCHAWAANKGDAIKWLDRRFRTGFRSFNRAWCHCESASV